MKHYTGEALTAHKCDSSFKKKEQQQQQLQPRIRRAAIAQLPQESLFSDIFVIEV
ncbi:MAG: hypothetical protein M3275_03165 [Thermoproteota archaeon]|nr:hypothetical protein [Thermoproteota archaeon]